MPLIKQNQPVQFVGGVDTKTDPKQLSPAKLLKLQNGVFTHPGKIGKRNGFGKVGAALPDGKAIATFKGELLGFDGANAYSYNAKSNTWASKGPCASVSVTRAPVAINSDTIEHADCAVSSSGLKCFAWEVSSGNGISTTPTIRYSIIDSATGNAIVQNGEVYAAGGFQPKVVAFGGYFLIFFCLSTTFLCVASIPVATPTDTPTVQTIVTDLYDGRGTYIRQYDAFPTASKCYVVWNGLPGVLRTPRAAYLDASLALSTPVSVDSSAKDADYGVCVFTDASGNVVLAYNDSHGSTFAYALNSGLTAEVNARITIATGSDLLAAPRSTNITGIATTAGNFRLAWTRSNSDGTFDAMTGTVVDWAFFYAGPLKRSCAVAGKLFMVGETPHLFLSTQSEAQSSFFLTSLDGYVSARLLTGVGGGHLKRGSVPESNNGELVAMLEKVSSEAVGGVVTSKVGVVSESFAWDDPQASWNFQELGGNLHVSGGFLQMYDGAAFVEHGFHQYPEGIGIGGVVATVKLDGAVAGDYLTVGTQSFVCGTHFTQGGTDQETASFLAAALVAAGYTGSSAEDVIVSVAFENLSTRVAAGDHMTITRATGRFGTIECSAVKAGDSVSINGVELVCVLGAPTGRQFQRGMDDNATATNLAAAIQANVSGVNGWVDTGALNTVQVYADGGVAVRWSTNASTMTLAEDTNSNPLTYQYVACYEWTDNQGQIHYSAPSVAVSAPRAVAVGRQTGLRVTVPTLKFTAKSNVRVVVYRTEANGQNFYKTPGAGDLYSNALVASVALSDTLGDADLIGNAPLYTTGGVIENDPCPPCSSLVAWQNRLVALDSERPLSPWYSKEIALGAPVEFSGLLTIPVDPRGGDTTAIASMDEKLLPFKRDRPFYVGGQGADSTGSGASLQCVPVPSSAGCVTPKSVVLTSAGLMRQTEKGIWLLDRSLSDSYIGANIEAESDAASAPIVAAHMVPNTNQIRFMVSGGSQALVFDYLVNQWGVFTNVNGVGATVWDSLHTFIDPNGQVWRETPGVFSDDGEWIPLVVGTAWIQLAGLQGYQRAYRMLVLGSFKSECGVECSLYYDFRDTAAKVSNFALPGSTPSDEPLQLRLDFATQRCQSVRVEISDSDLYLTPGEGIDLSGLTFVVGIKRGSMRIPASQPVS